jgi:hypothetical protein
MKTIHITCEKCGEYERLVPVMALPGPVPGFVKICGCPRPKSVVITQAIPEEK